MTCPGTLAASVTALAVALAKDRPTEELELLASLFCQLGDTLATIAIEKARLEARCDKNP